MLKSCLSILFILATLLLLVAAGFFLKNTSEHTEFERLPVEESRFTSDPTNQPPTSPTLPSP